MPVIGPPSLIMRVAGVTELFIILNPLPVFSFSVFLFLLSLRPVGDGPLPHPQDAFCSLHHLSPPGHSEWRAKSRTDDGTSCSKYHVAIWFSRQTELRRQWIILRRNQSAMGRQRWQVRCLWWCLQWTSWTRNWWILRQQCHCSPLLPWICDWCLHRHCCQPRRIL